MANLLRKKAQGSVSIRLVLILIGLLPMLLSVTIITVVASGVVVENLEASIREELAVASLGLRELYGHQINNSAGAFPAYDSSYVDSMRAAGVDLTLFKGNVR